ncbi:diguanylate cyclase (GGDEF) domain-containing protein [Ruminococcus flavefaciens]|uniref:Diguanylate cyclase (GGDEF) domain-containing protein n=1 Tax=Ruminococcus flavefaciens TaxID=1265 RepID=A0A1H6KUX0_RUMFL|nr:GGDEF domain-containing protein [Ruminococcus flavefaciens]SEH79370.1 diguanylate cyclase (GGDEF) domain-containing protein [Ruminococcus flavefaciens]
MGTIDFENCTLENVVAFVTEEVDSIIVVDGKNDRYKTIVRKGVFVDFIEEQGLYKDLIAKLWYHFNNSSTGVVEDYHVFIPTSGKFIGKYSKRLNIECHGVPHVIQMTIYPTAQEDIYIFILDELDGSQYVDETLTNNKVKSIQNTYLFSMYVDIVQDTTNSISVTELSDEVMNQQLKYSEWRMMIVNMIWPDDQALFLQRTSPEYLKKNLAPGKTSSYDCLMMNLEGKYIWVKLIFSRAETNNDEDFRFVFMVQDIHDNTVELMSTLKKYEELASKDTLTSVYNHGRIETEIRNAIESKKRKQQNTSIMMIDIDYFKSVNDRFGHSVGDATLVRFVNTILDIIKARGAVLGRWGGEEFVVVLYDADAENSFNFAEKLRNQVAETDFENVGHITCSIGITQIDINDDFGNAFDRMDKAVYEAKSAGRNCVKVI